MKSHSKLMFTLGILTTITTLCITCMVINRQYSNSTDLLNEGKKRIKHALEQSKSSIDDSVNAIKKDAKSLLNQAAQSI